jgi:hypothetical protein
MGLGQRVGSSLGIILDPEKWNRLMEKQPEVFGVRAVVTSPAEMEAEPSERDV